MIRLTTTFQGRVQGVGFRFNTAQVARSYDVTGYVMNLPDGTVEMVAEGEAKEVKAFTAAVHARMADFITQTTSNQHPPTGQFKSFGIKH